MEQSVAALMQQVLPEISNVSIEGFEQIAGGFSRAQPH
jgi:hypothetical protein